MNDLDTATDRRFDAELGEAMGSAQGDDMPRDLGERILRNLNRRTVPGEANVHSVASRKRSFWLAAAGLLFGIVVVASVASTHDQDAQPDLPSAATQDPQAGLPKPIVLSNESLRAEFASATKTELPGRGDVMERLLAIADSPSVNLIVAAHVEGKSNVDLKGCTAQEAIERVASEVNAQVNEIRGALIVGGLGRSGRVGQRLTLSGKAIPVRAFFKKVHQKTHVNFVVSELATGTVQCDVKDMPWRLCVDSVCKQLGFEAVGCGTVLAIRPKHEPKPPRLHFMFHKSPVGEILDTCAKVGGCNLVIDPKVKGKLTVKTHGVSLDGLLQSIASTIHASIEHDDRGITRIVPGSISWSTDLTMEATTMRKALQANGVLENEPTPEDAKRAKVSVFVHEAVGKHVTAALDVASQPAPAKPKARGGK